MSGYLYLLNTFTWKKEINIKIKEKIISKFIKKNKNKNLHLNKKYIMCICKCRVVLHGNIHILRWIDFFH